MHTGKGKLIVLTAPSGGGKSTVARHLLKTFEHLKFSISATTRKPRIGEKHGKQYYFKSEEQFQNLIERKAFVEYEEVYPNQFYGTLKSELDRLWDEGYDILFDVDVKGAKNLKSLYKSKCFTIFVKPPSVDVLIERLKARGTETEASLAKRIERFNIELTYEDAFDYVLINDKLDKTLTEAEQITKTFLEE